MHENETLTSDFACSSTLAWQYGRRVFLDPLPQNATHAHDVVQVLFTLTGSFNCDLLSNPTNISLFFNGALVVTNIMPLAPPVCYCGNCNTQFFILSPLFQRSIPQYHRGGSNELIVDPKTTICLHRIDMLLFYAPAIPTIARVEPLSADLAGDSLVHFFTATSFPAHTIKDDDSSSSSSSSTSFLCVFGNDTVAVNRTESGNLVCLAPSVPAPTSMAVFLQHDMPTLGAPVASDPTFVYFEPIDVVEVRPAFGPSIGGTAVQLIGNNFLPSLPNVCRFGAADVNCSFVDNHTLSCTTPRGNAEVNVTFLPNGQDAAAGALTFQFEEVANYLYIIVAFVFVIFSVGTAVAVRICLYRRRMNKRHFAALGGGGEAGVGGGGGGGGDRAPLLAGVLDDSYLEQIDVDEIQLAERIGKGTYGEVFKGVWRGTVVAVKKLPGHNITPNLLADFLKEVRLMKQLRHPCVLQFLGACITENHRDLAIIMEFMPRNSLWSILHDEAQELAWPTLLAMLVDTARGMCYLHTRRPPIIHRDLKSHNLLVDEAWRVKVCDFGLSRIIEANPSLNTMTACGTPCWTAPEVLRSLRYSYKADVYSFGIVVWECASRQDPFAGLPPFQVVFAVGNNGLRPEVPENCPKRIANLMRRCWHEDPNMRPPFDVVVGLLLKMQLSGSAAST